jgi:high affinity Mn2+ porin
MLGDGRLAYAAERVLDAYYAIALGSWGSFSLEVQRFNNPAFNQDRGPVTVYGIRLHLQL